MAKQIIWSLRAQGDRKEILEYWSQHNKSNRYSKKLNQLFKASIQLIVKHPQVGKPTDTSSVRIKIVKEYLLIYEVSATSINILSIWDGRQDPFKLKDML